MTVTHLNTNQARRRVTLLIETTVLPLSHTTKETLVTWLYDNMQDIRVKPAEGLYPRIFPAVVRSPQSCPLSACTYHSIQQHFQQTLVQSTVKQNTI